MEDVEGRKKLCVLDMWDRFVERVGEAWGQKRQVDRSGFGVELGCGEGEDEAWVEEEMGDSGLESR